MKTIEYVVGWDTLQTNGRTRHTSRWFKDRRSALSKYISIGLSEKTVHRYIRKVTRWENGSSQWEKL